MTTEEQNVDVEPTPPADQDGTASPELEAKLAEITAAREQAENKLREHQVSTEKTIQELSAIVADAFSKKPEPEPEPTVEIDPMDPETYVKAMETVADKKVKQGQAVTGQVMRTLLEDSFESKKEALKARNPKVWEKVGPRFEEFYAENPQEKLRGPQSAEQVYEYYAGKWMLENPEGLGEVRPEVPVTPTVPNNAPPVEDPNAEKEPELTEDEARLARLYGVDPKKYAENRDNRRARKNEGLKEERRLY